MSRPKPDFEERQNRILDAAVETFLRQGYEKTTLGDVAVEAGVSRGVIYLHFSNKDSLFESLLYREVLRYNKAWLEILEQESYSGTIAGVFRAVLIAVNKSTFISALLRQDRRIFGSYLRKPGNLFESIQANALWIELLTKLQAAGAIRSDIQPTVFAHIMTSLALGLMMSEGNKTDQDNPAFEDIMEATATLLERTLTPEDGGNPEAGRVIIQRLAQVSQAQFNQLEIHPNREKDHDS